jgi:glycosyltransferase involved in cell wall biosynthesis
MIPPLITCGLTTYNAEDTVKKALDSVFRQTWRSIEVVAIDDCSSDGTWEILEGYAQDHPELRLYRNPVNGGVAVSRNRIMEEARGEFLAFFDDDDESLPERLAAQYQRIVTYEQQYATGAPVICHTARMVFYPNGKLLYHPAMGQDAVKPAPSGLSVYRHILLGTPLKDSGACPTCCQMARLSTYQALGGFDPEFRRMEDTDLSIRLAEMGGHFAGIAVPLVKQTMTKTSEKSLQEEYVYNSMMLKKHHILLEREGQYDFCRRWVEIKFTWLQNHRFDFLMKFFSIAITHPVLTGIRLINALPNIGINLSMQRFYKNNGGKADRLQKNIRRYQRVPHV